MEELDENLLQAITHYQNALERYLKRQDETKMLHSLSRLYKLPIKTCHLEKTGVGRTVNSLRKLEGKVGNAAKALVAKWKEMVVQEETKQVEERHEDEDRQSSSHKIKDHKKLSGDKHKSKHKHKKHDLKENKHKEKHRKRSHSSSDQNDKLDDEENSNSDSDVEVTSKKLKLNNETPKSQSEDEGFEGEAKKHKSSKKHKHKSSKEHKDKSKLKEDSGGSSSFNKDKKKSHKSKETKDINDESYHSKHKKSKHIGKDKDNPQEGSSTKPEKKKNSKVILNSIGSESGTSFADALGMCEPPISKKKKNQAEKLREPNSPEVLDDESSDELPAPKEPLENLDINIATLLPPITPNYRPLGLPIDDQPKKIMTDDEALSRVMMNKNQRTKVYSGNKVIWGKVPSLFDLCVRILQDNLDALEYTGGVPYSILKPILEKATANQLYMMEHHNPYLIEESDELWKLHCQKEFKNKSREEMETWRDMYMRCLDEREAKLRALTANIKQAQDKSLPVRTTKLAYVDSVAKPPRNIARKQMKNDSGKPTPSLKLLNLATRGEASKVAVPNPGARAVERSSGSSHQVKVKKAPLMAKTLSLFKNRFRR